MGITRKQALKRIEGLIGEATDAGIESHIEKLTRRGSGPHVRAELNARIAEIERLAEHVGEKTRTKIIGEIAIWRKQILEIENVD